MNLRKVDENEALLEDHQLHCNHQRAPKDKLTLRLVSDGLKLRLKTALVICVITAIVFSSIIGIVDTLLMEGFTHLENQNVDQNVQRVINAFSDELSGLDRFDYNWAVSDPTYQFVQNPQQGQTYIQTNLLDSTLINANVQVIVYFNQTGNVIYSKALDSNNIGIQVPKDVLNAIEANTELWNHTTWDSRVTGVLSTSEGLLMVASEPILTSQGLGPVMGALLMGRYIDDKEVADLSDTVRLPLAIENLSNSQLPTDFQKALSLMSEGQPLSVQPLSADIVAGYATINGLSGVPVLILRIELPRDIYNQGQQAVFYLSLCLGLVCLVFGSSIMLLMEKVVLTPVAKLDKEAKCISQDPKRSRSLEVKGDDELASLGTTLNNMLVALEQSQALATIGELTTALANDLRNPLQGINAAAYYLKTKLGPTADKNNVKMLALIEKDIGYSDRIISQLLQYSEPLHLDLGDTTLREIVKNALHDVKVPDSVQVLNEMQNDIRIRVDKQKMQTVLVRLCENAIEAMPRGGVLRIESMSINGDVVFKLSDSGVGISPEHISKLWSPLFSTKAKGMGLSLPTCKRIVEAHGGNISVESTIDKGSTFTVTIPDVREQSTSEHAPYR